MDSYTNNNPAEGVLEKDKIISQEPPQFRVILLNDNYTTQDFVVMVLVQVFHKSIPEATKIMMDVHKKGKGIVGTYTKDIALTRVKIVENMAKKAEFPLKCQVEAV